MSKVHTPPKVFISYSHDSREHIERVLRLADQLRIDGIDADIDQYHMSPPEGWSNWVRHRIAEADFVIVICTEAFKRRFEGEDKESIGLGVKWEGAVLQREIFRNRKIFEAQSKTIKFFPVIFSEEDAAHVPLPFAAITYFDLSDERGYEFLYRALTNQLRAIGKALTLPSQQELRTLTGLRLFLCHSAKDKPLVRQLYERLTSYGAQPWLDEEDLLAGQIWSMEIPKAIRASHSVIVCLSPNAVTEAGYFHKEIKFALDVLDEQPEGTIFIIPIRFAPCDIPERLGHIHCINLFEDKGFDKLVLSLRFRTQQIRL
jgi:hypothetical protein